MNDLANSLDQSSDQYLQTLACIHDLRGGPRAAYAYSLGRATTLQIYPYSLTGDLDTNKVEDFIIAFYTAYNRRFGQTY